MTHSPSENDWKPPPVDSILCNIDRIYAAGLFWRVVSPQLFERQSQIMSAVALMAEKLEASLPPPDRTLQQSRRRRSFPTLPPPQTRHDSLIARHRVEVRLYAEAVTRAQNRSMTELDPTADNIALVYKQLTASLEFWEDAKFWCGMPWWRKPRLDLPWAPLGPSTEIVDDGPRGPSPSPTLNDSQRMVTFSEDEKDSSPKAPALVRVPRCSVVTTEASRGRAFRPRVKLVSA